MNTAIDASPIEVPAQPFAKVGDFVQLDSHFGDVFFEVTSAFGDWGTFVRYEKYGRRPLTDSWSGRARVRRVISAEMAIPTIVAKRNRFHAVCGQYDPFYGFAPAGQPLRIK